MFNFKTWYIMKSYAWIEVNEIESVEEVFPYLRIHYRSGETFLIDWNKAIIEQRAKWRETTGVTETTEK